MKKFLNVFRLVLLVGACVFFGHNAFAAAPALTEAQVKLDFIKTLESDGYLSAKMANEAREKYVDSKQLSAPASSTTVSAEPLQDSLWTRYFSWLGLIKVGAIVLLLIAGWGTVQNIIKGLWHILVKVPAIVYQLPLLAGSIYATLMPQSLWESQAIYVALLAAFLNLILMVWVLAAHPKVAATLAKLFQLGIPFASVVSFWLMMYFGALALHYQSIIFGFFTVISFSSMLSFGLYYSSGTLTLHFDSKALFAVVFGHLAVVVAYVTAQATGHYPASFSVFSAGIEYYATIALCVGLLCGSAPFCRKDGTALGMSLLFVVVATLATASYFMLGQHVIGSLVVCFFILFLLDWIGYWGYQTGLIVGSLILGGTLYGLAMFLEKHSTFLVLTMS